MEQFSWAAVILFVIDWIIRGGLSLRIIMRRRSVGETFAWLTIVLIVPFAGAAIYLFFGELRLGNRRAEWARRIHEPYQGWLNTLDDRYQIDWQARGEECPALARLTKGIFGVPPLPGAKIEMLPDWQAVFHSLIADIDAAQRTIHMQFYIWNNGGLADEVAAALMRASKRGVICRVLVDAVGSRPFLRSSMLAQLRAAGVRVQAALPAGLFRMLFFRLDLRMHRKIVVIDGETAYTGSLNLVDPRHFKQSSGVGQWVDAMVRVQGPIVESLAIIFLEDWELETNESSKDLAETHDVHNLSPVGEVVAQTIPSGPVFEKRAIHDILLMAIYSARQEIVLTTPYFVPDEALATALANAAQRGVEVTLIMPQHVDSFLVRYASQAHKGDLLQAGVKIAQFQGGLLHTKSIAVDGRFCLFGSVNLDSRSLHLNYEITLAIYDREVTAELRALQQHYVAQSTPMELKTWQNRSFPIRVTENVLRLLSPLL